MISVVNLYLVCKTFLFYLLIHFYALLLHHKTYLWIFYIFCDYLYR